MQSGFFHIFVHWRTNAAPCIMENFVCDWRCHRTSFRLNILDREELWTFYVVNVSLFCESLSISPRKVFFVRHFHVEKIHPVHHKMASSSPGHTLIIFICIHIQHSTLLPLVSRLIPRNGTGSSVIALSHSVLPTSRPFFFSFFRRDCTLACCLNGLRHINIYIRIHNVCSYLIGFWVNSCRHHIGRHGIDILNNNRGWRQ